jgi:hypothetical protein
METSDRPNKSTEEQLNDAILQVQSAALSKEIFHLSHVFTGDPNGCFAVNSMFVVCEDKLAPALHERLDATVREFFEEHEIAFQDSLDKEVDDHKSSEEKVIPISGIYRKKDGYLYMNLDLDTSQKLDQIAEFTGLDRDGAMEMVLDHLIEHLKREKKDSAPTRQNPL